MAINIFDSLVRLPRVAKQVVMILVDAALCVLTVWLAYYLRLGLWVSLSDGGWLAAVIAITIVVPTFAIFGLYRTAIRFAGSEAMITIARAAVTFGLIYAAIITAYGIDETPRTIGLIQPVLLFIFVGSSRVAARYGLTAHSRLAMGSVDRRVLIYGAGSSGRQLAAALAMSPSFRAIGFIDDDRHLHGSTIANLPVSSPERIEDLVRQRNVSEIILAVPSATRRRRNEIIAMARSAHVAVKTLPGLMELVDGSVTVNDLRPLEIDDLLSREPITASDVPVSEVVNDKIVLVTGAGGSIGSELCRQILATNPQCLLLLDVSEFALYSIHEELLNHRKFMATRIIPLIGSVHDEVRMRRIFEMWRPNLVLHAAAYKHVPIVEHNLLEGVRNNVIGTKVCANFAEMFGAERFVLVSTDKAVRPTNVMGATKRFAELVLQAMADRGGATRFSMVRFGNVLGSSGSVVPLFRKQIAQGGPLTVTDPRITRYFMTIPEAAHLVLQAMAMARGGEVFVLDMGEPVKILDLAIKMIELSGLEPRTSDGLGDIEIRYTGLRPGEKLYEELLIGNNPVGTRHDRIMMAREQFLSPDIMDQCISKVKSAIEIHNLAGLRDILMEVVPEYHAGEIVDWTA